MDSQQEIVSGSESGVIRWSTADATVTPIAIFAFNRLDLLRATIKSLEGSEGFPGGPVFVFSDAARSHVSGEEEKVEALRRWLRVWCQRVNATLIEADSNQGLRRSIIGGVSSLLEQYERVIVLEDDIVVSRHFLPFMRQALTTYQNSSDVVQVSGYFIPHRKKVPNTGLLSVPACWGWATWRRAWKHYSDDAAGLLTQIPESDVHRFNIEGTYAYYDALRRNAEGTQNTWAVRWYASVFVRRGLTVYPGKSLTRNIGFEEGGTNCGAGTMARVFNHQKIQGVMPVPATEQLPLGENQRLRQVLADFYRWQQLQWSRPTVQEVWAARWARMKRMITGK